MAQSQLLSLILLQYRDQREKSIRAAIDLLTRERSKITVEEMEHIRTQLEENEKGLNKKRRMKLEKLCRESGDVIREEDYQSGSVLETELFNTDGLRRGCDAVRIDCERTNVTEVNGVGVGDNGRLSGSFVSGSVVNLSKKVLSEADINLLSKGLKFSPTPTDINKAELKEDLEVFKRRIRLKWHFKDNEDIRDKDKDINKFKIKSNWQPPKSDPLLENYLSLLEKEVMSVSPEGKNFSNLSPSERVSLNNLKCDRDIVIKEADKGSAVVVWDRGDYINEANRQLDDKQVYEEVEVDPTVELGKTINSKLKELREVDPGLAEVTGYLQAKDSSKLGRFYLLPKIHKGLDNVKGRPVISNCGTLTEHISEYLDHHLNPLVSQGTSYIKDTNHFLARLSKLDKIPEGALLCTVDVVGLYPSIPHGEGLEAIKQALDRRENPEVATDTLVGLASLVLDNNYFEFNDKIYRQKLGTAIGTKFAPAYANLFMTRLEERLVDTSVEKPLIWMRYIDDIFFIWMHGEAKLKEFIDHLNSSHDTIKFTSEHSGDSISFLDVQVTLSEGGSPVDRLVLQAY